MYSVQGKPPNTALFTLVTTVSFAACAPFSSDSAVDAAGDPYFPLLGKEREALILPFDGCGAENPDASNMSPVRGVNVEDRTTDVRCFRSSLHGGETLRTRLTKISGRTSAHDVDANVERISVRGVILQK